MISNMFTDSTKTSEIQLPLANFDMAGAECRRMSSEKVFARLKHLESIYPDFRTWFFGKVLTEAPHRRRMFLHWHNQNLVGVAIAKRSITERKLCTLWVDDAFRASGVAGALSNQAFEWLGTERPLFTVPEEKIGEFHGLLNRWDFSQVQSIANIYRSGKREYVFNGRLTLTKTS